MNQQEKANLFEEIKSFGNVFHCAALKGHFDILMWLTKKLTTHEFETYRGNLSWCAFDKSRDERKISSYFNNGSELYSENKAQKTNFIKKRCHNNVLNCMYPWIHTGLSRNEFKKYKACIGLLLKRGACLSDSAGFCYDRLNINCYSISQVKEHLPNLNFASQRSDKSHRLANQEINSILSDLDQLYTQLSTEKRIANIKFCLRAGAVGALGLLAVAWKMNLYKDLKPLSFLRKTTQLNLVGNSSQNK